VYLSRTDISQSQSAIVRGAALRGLEGTRPDVVIAKRHYGWCWDEDFREGVDDEANSYVDKFDGRKRCRGRMHWVISKVLYRSPNSTQLLCIDPDFVQGQELYEDSVSARTAAMVLDPASNTDRKAVLSLYSCSFTSPPERVEHFSVQRVGSVETDLGNVSLTNVGSKYNSYLERRIYRYEYEVDVRFRSEEGVLAFKTRAYGEQRGTTCIKFD
jgi:hypothetical protein